MAQVRADSQMSASLHYPTGDGTTWLEWRKYADRQGNYAVGIFAVGEDRNSTTGAAAILVAANGSPIRCYKTRTCRLSILGHKYKRPFVIADVKFPLLDADFFTQHGLLVDVGRKRLLDTGTCRSRPLSAVPGMPVICSISLSKYSTLLHGFSDVFKPELHQVPGTQAKHVTQHHFSTTGPSTHAKFHHLPPKKLQDGKRAFAEMERMGICKKALSPWTSLSTW
ncbi:uncharacterized protein LOC135212228 [Macrobrachium nipponense]|uniref:uncharacterized protein LOC135212228 n=1 Tax=Macrobrachium nipponense TaxID=159736 RepID=UPI0030C89A13